MTYVGFIDFVKIHAYNFYIRPSTFTNGISDRREIYEKIQKCIDVNAHIENVKGDINVNDEEVVASISFKNLGDGDIVAIKFTAKGYNSFGDIVLINDKEEFLFIIQDIMIYRNQSAENLKVKLPNAEIRKLDLEECQICYADGTIVSYEGKKDVVFELEEIYNQEQLRALRKLYDKNVKYKPQEFEEGWVCSCGRFNRYENERCSLCSKSKNAIENVFSDDNLNKLIEEYRISEDKDRKNRELEYQKIEKEKKKRKAIITLIVIICIVMIFPISNSIKMSKRTVYESEMAMREALQGTYTNYYEEDSYSQGARKKINISGETLTMRWVNLGSDRDMNVTIDEWNYKEGTIVAGGLGTFVITKEGDIKSNDGLYENGGSWLDTEPEKSYNSYESVYTALKITDLELEHNSSYTVCTGKVENTGEKTYYYVELKGSFKDMSGNVLDTDWTYAVGTEGLAPGESTSFRISVDKDYEIDDCSVSILDYDN